MFLWERKKCRLRKDESTAITLRETLSRPLCELSLGTSTGMNKFKVKMFCLHFYFLYTLVEATKLFTKQLLSPDVLGQWHSPELQCCPLGSMWPLPVQLEQHRHSQRQPCFSVAQDSSLTSCGLRGAGVYRYRRGESNRHNFPEIITYVGLGHFGDVAG